MTTLLPCQIEESIAPFQMPGNNTFPLWCYGAPTITRYLNQVYATIPEVSPDLPPMCNTRPQLFRKTGDETWQRIFTNPIFDQREPCPIASLGDGRIVVSINSAITPFRADPQGSWRMWYCEPYLLSFQESSAEQIFPQVLKPAWDVEWPFTDHSYRGLASDAERQELFVMNIEGYQWQPGSQGRYHWAMHDASGRWINNGCLEFPIRCCYPCVSLKDRRVNIIATGDIDEPNPAWAAYKRDFADIPYDFAFRKLYFTYADDIACGDFIPPVLIEDCDDTAGHIKHCDLYVDDDNVAHILYVVRNIGAPYMRDQFFPGQTLNALLKVVRVQAGRVLSEQVISACHEAEDGALWSHAVPTGDKNTTGSFKTNQAAPIHAAFHAATDGRLFVFYCLSGYTQDGSDLAKNYLVEVTDGAARPSYEVALRDPLKVFYSAPLRNGSTPSDQIDLFGIGKHNPEQINYVRIDIPNPND